MHYDQAGKALCKRPLWLIVMGQQRATLTLRHIYQAYSLPYTPAGAKTAAAIIP
jgi:hypothetical protein